MNIFIGIAGIIISFLLVVYRSKIKFIIGEISWAEEHFGPGGTYTALLLFGFLLFLLSLMILTGTLDLILGGFTHTFFGAFS